MKEIPTIYMGRYLGEEVVRRVGAGELVPVRMTATPPPYPLPYNLAESAPSFVPGRHMLTEQPLKEWPARSCALLDRLDALGIERVAGELREIGERHGGLPLVLLEHEDLLKGHRGLRVVVAYWVEERAGRPVYELADDGHELHHTGVHSQSGFERPVPKEPKTGDARYAHEEHIADWPLSHDDIEQWVASRYWQYARTAPNNPHSYSLRTWGDAATFELLVQHLREHGSQEVFGRTEYTYLDTSDRKLWTMGNALETTALVNCKFHDPEQQALLAEEQTGKSREELGLDIPRPEVRETVKASDRSLGNGSTATRAFGTPELFGEEKR